MSYSNKANYKKLGDYIEVINIRNKELEVKTLLGVSIKKVLMPSIANTVGTNMKTYKIIEKNQFAYGPVTSRNGDKISIALLEEHEKAIVSQAYSVFEITDKSKLNPEYLMMWFRRPEFDRYARFKSHGSARETFDWEELCDIELPIPSIEKQNAIVKEYNTVVNRITLNETLNQKLEETAQALYKHWFVDFEFPNEDGKPYKSSGGKLVFNEELDMKIPEGWEVDSLINRTVLLKRGISPKYSIDTDLVVINQKCIRNNTVNLSLSRFHNSNLKSVPEEKIIQKLDVLVNSTGTGTLGRVGIVKKLKSEMTADSHVTIVRANQYLNKYYLASFLSNNEDAIVELGEGSTGQTELSRNNLGSMLLPIPLSNMQKLFEEKISKTLDYSLTIESLTPQLIELKDLLLSKMTKVES